jgi:hypothetical protein
MIIRILKIVPLVLAGWLAVLAGVMYVSDDAPGALVLFPDEGFIANLPDGIAILDSNAIGITVTGDRPRLTRALYAAGGTLVLPAGLAGCVGLS